MAELERFPEASIRLPPKLEEDSAALHAHQAECASFYATSHRSDA